MNVNNQWAQVGRVLDAHGESRRAGLVHRDLLDVMGAGAGPRCVVQRVGKAPGHAVHGAAVLVDRRLRPGVHGRSRASCHILLVEPVLVQGAQAVARSSSVGGQVGPQQEWQLVPVGARVGVHHSVWAPVTKGVLGSPALPRRVGLLQVVMAGGQGGAQA